MCVRRQWADFLKDTRAAFITRHNLSGHAVEGLRRTRVPLNCIEFAPADDGDRPDPASALLLTDRSLLPVSLATLEVRQQLMTVESLY